MKKQVRFKNTSDNKMFIEFEKFKADFMKEKPHIFDTEVDKHALLTVITSYGEFFVNENDAPKYFMLHANKDSCRFNGFIDLGDTVLSTQKGGSEAENLLQMGSSLKQPYEKKSDNPICYHYGSEPHFDYCFFEDHAMLKQSDYFDVKVEYFPFAVIDHSSIWNDTSVIYQTGLFTGTYHGIPVKGLIHTDKSYAPETIGHPYELLGYIDNEFDGIRQDGKRETAIVHIDSTGKVFAYYWLEGENPVLSDTVIMETEWMHLPYCDDGTCIYKDVIYKFADKEIHFNGKWGSKGFTLHPRLDKNGQSQVFGSWYEGDTPYKHEVYMTFNENQLAFDYKIKELGFDVID